jgi:high-affinity Fe2+/Pb2+ permease
MSKNRTGLYLGLAAAGAGGYYLYRAGGDVKGAKQEMKSMFISCLEGIFLGITLFVVYGSADLFLFRL